MHRRSFLKFLGLTSAAGAGMHLNMFGIQKGNIKPEKRARTSMKLDQHQTPGMTPCECATWSAKDSWGMDVR